MPINICVMISDRRLTRHKQIEAEEECDRRQKRSCRICGMGPRKAEEPDRAGVRRGPGMPGLWRAEAPDRAGVRRGPGMPEALEGGGA